MSHLDDGHIRQRSGFTAPKYAQTLSRSVLFAQDSNHIKLKPLLYELDDTFITKKLNLGSTSDLLALAIFIDMLVQL